MSQKGNYKKSTLLKPASFFVWLIFLCFSCAPKIIRFDATPLTISKDDSVLVTWKVQGKPVLIEHDKMPMDSSNAPGMYFKEFTLVVQKNKKEVKRKKQIIVLPGESKDVIIFNTTLNGDTLIAKGISNPELWNNKFQISSVASASGRPIFATHENKTASLNASGILSKAFEGTPVSGYWELKSLLTPQEKKDMSLAPATLRINIIIQYKSQ
ncbi:MAG: hypothetical protein ABI358_09770 [Ginsengibacter sp.]